MTILPKLLTAHTTIASMSGFINLIIIITNSSDDDDHDDDDDDDDDDGLWQDLANRWHEVKQLVPDRDQTLHNELLRQQNNERLRRAFAQKANVVGQWIERHLDAIASAAVQKGKLEDQLTRLRAIDKEVAAFRPSFDELERYNHEIQEAMIFDNRHTPYTMEVGGT